MVSIVVINIYVVHCALFLNSCIRQFLLYSCLLSEVYHLFIDFIANYFANVTVCTKPSEMYHIGDSKAVICSSHGGRAHGRAQTMALTSAHRDYAPPICTAHYNHGVMKSRKTQL